MAFQCRIGMACLISFAGVIGATLTPALAHADTNIVSVSAPAPPTLASTTLNSISVEWQPVPVAVQYKVYFRPVGQSTWWNTDWLSFTTTTHTQGIGGIGAWEFALQYRDADWNISPLSAASAPFSPGSSVPEDAPTVQSSPQNGMYFMTGDLVTAGGAANETTLRAASAAGLRNLYLQVGYPNPTDDPSLTGIVPPQELGLQVNATQVANLRSAMARIDPNFRLWAWFGTFASGSDSEGHAAGKVDISTAQNRSTLIASLERVATWTCPQATTGNLCFDGVQDDTEDLNVASVDPETGQFDSRIVDFWNTQADHAHARGQKMAPYVPITWENFNRGNDRLAALTQPDFLIMSSPGGYNALAEHGTDFISHAKRPVVINIQSDTAGDMRNFARVIDKKFASNPAVLGYSLYNWPSFQVSGGAAGTELDVWKSWHR